MTLALRTQMFPRSMFDMDTWFNPTLDNFDPFDEMDRMLSRNLEWINRPSFLEPMPVIPKVPRKYRVTVDCAGYAPSSLKTEIIDGKLVVHGKEDTKTKSGDFSTKEFRKTYKLPKHCETDKMISFVTPMGLMVVEVPLKLETGTVEDLVPKIVDTKEGKRVEMVCTLPTEVNPEKLEVTCKDRDIIIKGEDVQEKPDSVSRFHYYKRCTLPENTDLSAVKCTMENKKLKIEAPINPALTTSQRVIPIEMKK
jgi:HSP20 family molecular chaperone IbpA